MPGARHPSNAVTQISAPIAPAAAVPQYRAGSPLAYPGVTTIAAAGAAQVLQVTSDGTDVYDVTLNLASCAFTFVGWQPGVRQNVILQIRQDATAGRAFTLPGSGKWHNNNALVPVTTAGTVIVIEVSSTDGGTTLVYK